MYGVILRMLTHRQICRHSGPHRPLGRSNAARINSAV